MASVFAINDGQSVCFDSIITINKLFLKGMQYAICNMRYSWRALCAHHAPSKTHCSPLAGCCRVEPSCIPVNTLSHSAGCWTNGLCLGPAHSVKWIWSCVHH